MNVDLLELREKDIQSYGFVKASWLQKCVRRGLVEKAVAIARLYLQDNQPGGLQRKLLVFCYEDIGLGVPHMNLLLKAEPDLLKQTELLASAPKNRENDRFLLAARDFPSLAKRKETAEEVNSLIYLCDIADAWFENKRDKKAKAKLIEAFDLFKENATEEGKEIISQAVEDYWLLSKHQSFGARTSLAHIVLTSVRQLSRTNFSAPKIYKLPDISLPVVDEFALDKHTPFGKKLGKTDDDWFLEGAPVFPERNYPELYLTNGEEKYPYSLWNKNS